MLINDTGKIEIYKVCTESIKVYTPIELREPVIDYYNEEKIILGRESKELKNGTAIFYINRGFALFEAALTLPNISFWRKKEKGFDPIIQEDYIDLSVNKLYVNRGKDKEDTISCSIDALHFVNSFKKTTAYNAFVGDSPLLRLYQEFVTFILETQNLERLPQHTESEWRQFVDIKWRPENYPVTGFSQAKREQLIALLPKTRE